MGHSEQEKKWSYSSLHVPVCVISVPAGCYQLSCSVRWFLLEIVNGS